MTSIIPQPNDVSIPLGWHGSAAGGPVVAGVNHGAAAQTRATRFRVPRIHISMVARVSLLFTIAVIVLVFSCGCSQQNTDPPITVTRGQWEFAGNEGRKFSTTHFDIYSTLLDQPFEDALPGFLEAAHKQYAALLPPQNSESRLQTYVFANRPQWDAFTRQRFPRRYPVYRQIGAGGYAHGNICVAYYLKSRAPTLSVLAHEGMHQYFAHHFKVPLPAWINEGLACYCESYDLPGGKPRFTPQRNTFRINALREALTLDALIPLKEMLATDAGKVIVAGQSRRIRTYYAQAWAMVLFLRDGGEGEYREGFDRMLADIAERKLQMTVRVSRVTSPTGTRTSFGESVFRAYITGDFELFDKAFRAYLHQLAGFRKPSDV